GRIYGSSSRTPITAVTLFGGFATTVCWPLSAYLAARYGWRSACFVYAAIQIAVALPIHLLALPAATTTEGHAAAAKRPASPLAPRRVRNLRVAGGSANARRGGIVDCRHTAAAGPDGPWHWNVRCRCVWRDRRASSSRRSRNRVTGRQPLRSGVDNRGVGDAGG